MMTRTWKRYLQRKYRRMYFQLQQLRCGHNHLGGLDNTQLQMSFDEDCY
jgi:hypothetical protein